jgi:hypothetical protein
MNLSIEIETKMYVGYDQIEKYDSSALLIWVKLRVRLLSSYAIWIVS